MRKSGYIIVLFTFIFVQLGTVIWYYSRPVIHMVCYNHLRTRPSEMDGNRDITIQTTLDSFQRARKDANEIFWKGAYYDFAELDIRGEQVVITAKKDKAESWLMELADNALQEITGDLTSQLPQDMRLFQWMFKAFLRTDTLVSTAHIQIPASEYAPYRNRLHPESIRISPFQPPDRLS
jgi:hypothetical protein